MGVDTGQLAIYGVIIVVALIALVIFSKISKAAATKNVRGFSQAGMTLEDLERMRETGFIQDEEYQTMRRKIAERTLEARLPRASQPAEIALQSALQEFQTKQAKAEARQSRAAVESALGANIEELMEGALPAPGLAGTEAPAAPPVPKAKHDPLEKLRATGAISEAEYQRLKAALAQAEHAPPEPEPEPPPDPDLLENQPQTSPPELDLSSLFSSMPPAAPLDEKELPPIPPLDEQPRSAAPVRKPPPPAPKRQPAPRPRSLAELPFDLEKLRAAGAVDDAEYQRLKAYFEKKRG